MAGIEIPKNTVTVSATLAMSMGQGPSMEYITTLSAQTHKLEEIEYLIERAWEATNEQASKKGSSATPSV